MIIEHWKSLQQIYKVWKDDHGTLRKFNTNLQSVERWSLNFEKIYNKFTVWGKMINEYWESLQQFIFTECGKMIIDHWENLQQIYRVWKDDDWTLGKFKTNFAECGKMIIELWENLQQIFRVWKDGPRSKHTNNDQYCLCI